MDASTIVIEPAGLPTGQVSVPYEVQFGATGGAGQCLFRIHQGPLPFGVDLSPQGLLSGTVAEGVSTQIVVEVQDSSVPPVVVQQAFAMVFSPGALAILNPSLANAVEGVPYQQAFTATAGQQPFHWKVVSGELPAGLALDDSGAITGSATSVQTCQFTVQVQDSAPFPSTAQAALTLNVVSQSERAAESDARA